MKMLHFGLMALLLSACAQDETLSGYIDRSAVWVLQEANDQPVSYQATLTLPKAGVVAGQGPCNRYWGRITAPLPWFSLSEIASTKRACPKLAEETGFFQALNNMETAEFFRDTLILRNSSGENLVFRTGR